MSLLRRYTLRLLADGEHAACERILRELPEWFGIEEAIREYVRDLQVMETWVAEARGRPVGFLTLLPHGEHACELHVIAVRREHHGRGCGRALVEHAVRLLRERGVEFLQVKTVGPSQASAHYERTRGFYEHLGFRRLEENRLWGEDNPCLILVRHLGAR